MIEGHWSLGEDPLTALLCSRCVHVRLLLNRSTSSFVSATKRRALCAARLVMLASFLAYVLMRSALGKKSVYDEEAAMRSYAESWGLTSRGACSISRVGRAPC